MFGDYDVDGACSAALMVALLRDLGCTVLPYVPDRMTEGYGPNAAGAARRWRRAARRLIVCVDCGTAAGEALARCAGEADVVVLDHHKAEGPPPAVAGDGQSRTGWTARSGLATLCAAGGGVPDRGGHACARCAAPASSPPAPSPT